MIWWITGIVFLAIAVYLAITAFDAKYDVSTAPRMDMMVCDKHGPIPKKAVLHLSGLTEKPIEYCPLCFSDKMKAAGR